MVLPGPQYLPIHLAVYHRPNVTTNHQNIFGLNLPDLRQPRTNFGPMTLTPIASTNGDDLEGAF